MAVASVRTDIVFASPGTPSSRTCPLANRPTSSRSTNCSWPTITLPISVRNFPIQPAAACTCSLKGVLIGGESRAGGGATQAILACLERKLRSNVYLDGICPAINSVSHGEDDAVGAIVRIGMLLLDRSADLLGARNRAVTERPPITVFLRSQ